MMDVQEPKVATRVRLDQSVDQAFVQSSEVAYVAHMSNREFGVTDSGSVIFRRGRFGLPNMRSKALRAGFRRTAQRVRSLPVGSSDRVSKCTHFDRGLHAEEVSLARTASRNRALSDSIALVEMMTLRSSCSEARNGRTPRTPTPTGGADRPAPRHLGHRQSLRPCRDPSDEDRANARRARRDRRADALQARRRTGRELARLYGRPARVGLAECNGATTPRPLRRWTLHR